MALNLKRYYILFSLNLLWNIFLKKGHGLSYGLSLLISRDIFVSCFLENNLKFSI